MAGELSLAGEIRPVRQMAKRARTAQALGFLQVFGPREGARTRGGFKGSACKKKVPQKIFSKERRTLRIGAPWTLSKQLSARSWASWARKGRNP